MCCKISEAIAVFGVGDGIRHSNYTVNIGGREYVVLRIVDVNTLLVCDNKGKEKTKKVTRDTLLY